MNFKTILLLGILLVSLLTSAPLSLSPVQASTVQSCSTASVQVQVLKLLNATRKQASLKALRTNSRLQQVATAHVVDMMTNNFFDHAGSDGSQVWDRATRAGYRYAAIGENIAWTQGFAISGAQAFQQWMDSPGHRDNMLSGEFRELGVSVGCRGDETWYVMVLGRR